jgi:F-type H+-transporting ATPase subunit b
MTILPTRFIPFFCFLLFFAADATAWAAGEFDLMDFTWRTVNFAILAVLLFYLTARKIQDFLRRRREDVLAALKQAEEERRQAEELYEETLKRLAEAEQEMQALTRLFESQALGERERIIAEAQALTRKIHDEAEARVAQKLRQTRQQLLEEAVRLSLTLAEEILRKKITPEDQKKIIEDTLGQVRSEIGGAGQYGRHWS